MSHSGNVVPFTSHAAQMHATAEESLKLLRLYMSIQSPSDRQRALQAVESLAGNLTTE